jgi:hypothetical protein
MVDVPPVTDGVKWTDFLDPSLLFVPAEPGVLSPRPPFAWY